MALQDLDFDTSTNVNCSVSGNAFSSGGHYTSRAQSASSFTAASNSIEIQWAFTAGSCVAGIGTDPYYHNDQNYYSIEYAIQWSGSTWIIYEQTNETTLTNSWGHDGTETLKITIGTDGAVNYYAGSDNIYTSSITASTAASHYFHCTGNSSGQLDSVKYEDHGVSGGGSGGGGSGLPDDSGDSTSGGYMYERPIKIWSRY